MRRGEVRWYKFVQPDKARSRFDARCDHRVSGRGDGGSCDLNEARHPFRSPVVSSRWHCRYIRNCGCLGARLLGLRHQGLYRPFVKGQRLGESWWTRCTHAPYRERLSLSVAWTRVQKRQWTSSHCTTVTGAGAPPLTGIPASATAVRHPGGALRSMTPRAAERSERRHAACRGASFWCWSWLCSPAILILTWQGVCGCQLPPQWLR